MATKSDYTTSTGEKASTVPKKPVNNDLGDTFVPAPDALIKEYGIIRAAVYGRVWRYCQMETGTCFQSVDNLAIDLRLNRTAVIRHLKALVADGFLEDLTPGLRNRPHTYRDTGKVRGVGVALDDTSNGKGISNSDSAVAFDDSTVAKSDLKIETNKETNKKDRMTEEAASIFFELEQFGYEVKAGEEHIVYTWSENNPKWLVLDAIKQSRFSGGVTLKYIDRVIDDMTVKALALGAANAETEVVASEDEDDPTANDPFYAVQFLSGDAAVLALVFCEAAVVPYYVDRDFSWEMEFLSWVENGITPSQVVQVVEDLIANNSALIDSVGGHIHPGDVSMVLLCGYSARDIARAGKEEQAGEIASPAAEAQPIAEVSENVPDEQPTGVDPIRAGEIAALERAKADWDAQQLKEHMQREAAESVGLPIGRWSAMIQGETAEEMLEDASRLRNKRDAQRNATREKPTIGKERVNEAKEFIAAHIKNGLALNPSGRDAESFIDYAADRMTKDKQGIDTFISWWISNFPDRAYWSFSRMQQNWPAAFATALTGQINNSVDIVV